MSGWKGGLSPPAMEGTQGLCDWSGTWFTARVPDAGCCGGCEWLYPPAPNHMCVCIHQQTLRWSSQRAEGDLGSGAGYQAGKGPCLDALNIPQQPEGARILLYPVPSCCCLTLLLLLLHLLLPPAPALGEAQHIFPAPPHCPLSPSQLHPWHGTREAPGCSAGS